MTGNNMASGDSIGIGHCSHCGGLLFAGYGHYCLTRQRCDCHSCTRARAPQPPIVFYDPTKGVLPQQTIDAAITTERDRCAKIAEEMGVAAINVSSEIMGLLRQHVARIAAKIRSGK